VCKIHKFMFVSPSWNTEDFVNHVDQAHRLDKTTTVLMSTASAKQIAVYSYTTVPSLRRPMQRGHSNGTLSPSNALNWTCDSPVHFLCSQTLQSVHCMVSTPHALSQIQHGNSTRRPSRHLASSDFQQCV